MTSETVESKFRYGSSTDGVSWCMYSALYIGTKGDKYEFCNSRGISLLSVVLKLYGRC